MRVHPGFDKAAGSIAAKESLPLDRAKAILAASARKASKKATTANPALLKVPR